MRTARQFLCIGAVIAASIAATCAGDAQSASRDQPYVRVAGLFGESDDEKAARLQHEADQDAQIRALNARLQDMESTVSRLTGQNEELGHRVTELNAKIDRQQKEYDDKLCAMAAQLIGASTGQGDPNAVPCPGSPVAAVPANPAPATAAGTGLAPPPGVLGTLPAAQAAAAPTAPDTVFQTEFNAAMNLVAGAHYIEASSAFQAFAAAHPDSPLASQALYWVGDIAFAQKDYDTASVQFATVIKKYSNSPRAPDSMFRLGQAQIALGKQKEGCAFLAALPSKYPKADKALFAKASDARKAACTRDS